MIVYYCYSSSNILDPASLTYTTQVMVRWVQVFCVYPPLDMVQLFYVPTLGVQEFPPLVVMDPLHFLRLMSVPPFEAHQVCSGGLGTGLQVVFGFPDWFLQCVKMVTWDCYVVIPPLSMQEP